MLIDMSTSCYMGLASFDLHVKMKLRKLRLAHYKVKSFICKPRQILYLFHSVLLQEHTGRVFRLQFDEFQIVSSSHDDTILIWDFLNVPVLEASARSPSRTYTYVSKWAVLSCVFSTDLCPTCLLHVAGTPAGGLLYVAHDPSYTCTWTLMPVCTCHLIDSSQHLATVNVPAVNRFHFVTHKLDLCHMYRQSWYTDVSYWNRRMKDACHMTNHHDWYQLPSHMTSHHDWYQLPISKSPQM